MRIVLIIIGAIVGIYLAARYLQKRQSINETLTKHSEFGCIFYLVYAVVGGLVGWIIYSLF